jgi:hypothetical protein
MSIAKPTFRLERERVRIDFRIGVHEVCRHAYRSAGRNRPLLVLDIFVWAYSRERMHRRITVSIGKLCQYIVHMV